MIQKKKFSDAIAANISVVGGLLEAKILSQYLVNIPANSEYLIPFTKGGRVVLAVEGSEALASFTLTKSGTVSDFMTSYNNAIDLDKANIAVTIYSSSGESYKLKVKNNNKSSKNVYFTIQNPY